MPPIEVIDGVKVTRLHFLLPEAKHLKNFRLDLWLAGWWYRWHTHNALCNIIRKSNPDIVHTHYLNELAEYTGLCLKDSFRHFPWIITFHGGDVDGEPFLNQANRDRFQTFSQQAIHLTACSAFLANQAQSLQPALSGKIEVIHNGVNIHQFSTARSSSVSQPYILAVGQLVPHKGFELLIRAFTPLVKKYQSVELWIAGDGSQRQYLEGIVQQNRLTQKIRFLGKVDECEVSSLMANSLFVALPSLREPFGIVALEAMAAGKPVLATPTGGLPEFLPIPPNRLVIPDIPTWEAALDEWITLSLEGTLKAHQNQQCASEFDWTIIADRYLRVYEQAIAHV